MNRRRRGGSGAGRAPAGRSGCRAPARGRDRRPAVVGRAARFREDELRRQRRFQLAELDAAKAQYGLAVRDEQPPERLQQLQAAIDHRQADIDQLTRAGDAAAEHRQRLQSVVAANHAEAKRRFARNWMPTSANRNGSTSCWRRSDRPTSRSTDICRCPGRNGLSCLSSTPSIRRAKIDNLWSAGLDQPSGSFGRVRRFDRCVTCHQGIQRRAGRRTRATAVGARTTLDLALDCLPKRVEPSENSVASPLLKGQRGSGEGFAIGSTSRALADRDRGSSNSG